MYSQWTVKYTIIWTPLVPCRYVDCPIHDDSFLRRKRRKYLHAFPGDAGNECSNSCSIPEEPISCRMLCRLHCFSNPDVDSEIQPCTAREVTILFVLTFRTKLPKHQIREPSGSVTWNSWTRLSIDAKLLWTSIRSWTLLGGCSAFDGPLARPPCCLACHSYRSFPQNKLCKWSSNNIMVHIRTNPH